MWTVFAGHILLGFTYDNKNNHCFFSRSFITSTCPAPLVYKHTGKLISVFTPAASTVCTAWQAATPSASMHYASSFLVPVIGKKSVTKTLKPLLSLFVSNYFPIMPIKTISWSFLACYYIMHSYFLFNSYFVAPFLASTLSISFACIWEWLFPLLKQLSSLFLFIFTYN